MVQRWLRVSLAMIMPLVAGCMNSYTRFYVPTPNLAQSARFLEPYSGQSQIFSSDDLPRDDELLLQRGYVMVGSCAFHGAGRVTQEMLVQQAKAVGADIVLTRVADEGSRQVAMPYVQYHPGTTSTTETTGTANANAYGSSGGYAYGTANYSGTSTTTTPGTYSTEMVPVTVESYAYGATFWRKGVPPTFGVNVAGLPPELRQSLQRNTGVVVKYVVDDSPAFRANVLVGDVIVEMDGRQVESQPQFMSMLENVSGRLVEVAVLRNGAEKTFKVQMNVRPPMVAANQPPSSK